MATYTLTPNSWSKSSGVTITNGSNAYTDTTSTTGAGLKLEGSDYACLGGFQFSTIPQNYDIVSVTVKLKAEKNVQGGIYRATLRSDANGTALSETIPLSYGSPQVYTLSLTESAETIIEHGSTLCIQFYASNDIYSISVYGAEIIVTAIPPQGGTYTLIPGWIGGNSTIYYPDGALTNTSSTTYAEPILSYLRPVYLGGFDFSNIIGEITNIVVKIKIKGDSSTYVRLVSSKDTNNYVDLSSSTAVSSSVTTYTLNLTAPIETIAKYASSLCIRISRTTSSSFPDIYGAELIITTSNTRVPNSVLFGEDFLVNLSTDTVGRADVLGGKTFHLPNGIQTTGTLNMLSVIRETSSTNARTISFVLNKEPSWFILACSSTNTNARSYRVYYILYDGTTTTTYYGDSSTAGSVTSSTSYGTFSYSSGTLSISVFTAPYLGEAEWTLYYL